MSGRGLGDLEAARTATATLPRKLLARTGVLCCWPSGPLGPGGETGRRVVTTRQIGTAKAGNSAGALRLAHAGGRRGRGDPRRRRGTCPDGRARRNRPGSDRRCMRGPPRRGPRLRRGSNTAGGASFSPGGSPGGSHGRNTARAPLRPRHLSGVYQPGAALRGFCPSKASEGGRGARSRRSSALRSRDGPRPLGSPPGG